MSAGSSGSNDSDRDIDPSLNSVKVANFILLYGLRTVVQLFHFFFFFLSTQTVY
jgi:hypothetical protein